MGRKSVGRTCPACDASTRNPKYCSNHCQREHYWQQAKTQIDDSGLIPAGRSGHTRLARRYLLLLHGERCAICDLTEWRGQQIPLVLDHINGDAADWRLVNLRLICANCDMQLPTYKNRNRGNGRAWRRQRYQDGLSY